MFYGLSLEPLRAGLTLMYIRCQLGDPLICLSIALPLTGDPRLTLLFGSRMTQESFQENAMKELGRLEGQLAGLRQELAALTLKQMKVYPA